MIGHIPHGLHPGTAARFELGARASLGGPFLNFKQAGPNNSEQGGPNNSVQGYPKALALGRCGACVTFRHELLLVMHSTIPLCLSCLTLNFSHRLL